MDLITTLLLAVILSLVLTHFAVQHALKGSLPVRGQTNIPGPGWTLPIIGDAWRFAGITNMKQMAKRFESLLGTSKKAVRFWMGPKLMVFVTDPKMGEAILNSPKATNKDPDVYHGFNEFSDGVFSLNGKGWRDLRRPLNNMMRTEKVMRNYDVFATKAEELRACLTDMCGKGTFDVLSYNQDCAMDIAFETLMGVPGESKHLEKTDLSFISRLIVICLQLAMNPVYKFSFVRKFSSLQRDMKIIQARILEFGKRLIKTRLEILEENYQTLKDPEFEPETYMDIALNLYKNELDIDKWDVERYREISKPLDMIVAAFGTSSFTVSTALLFLAQHPEYQERAYQEQVSIMGDALRAPTEDEIGKMEYLEMVYLETVRHVGVPGVFRQISSELVIDGYVFPEGTAVYLSLHYYNMLPENWVKTKDFYPDNFLPENVAKRPKAAWMPFSCGNRACPGVTFGRTVVMIVLSTLLRNFTLSTPLKYEEMDYEYMIMLESIKGYPLSLERRSVSAA